MKEDRDERTIKEIIEYLKKQNGNCSNELSNVEGLCLVNYIEWLEKEKDRLGKLFYERNEENIRLNNIINELEKWLEESIEKHTDDYIDWKYDRNVYLAGSKKLQNVFDKLQELKGSDSNVKD